MLPFRTGRAWDKDVIFDRLLTVGFLCPKVKLLLERPLPDFIRRFRPPEASGGRDALFAGTTPTLVLIVKLAPDGCTIAA